MPISRRDAAKDATIRALLPGPPARVFEASAGRGELAWGLLQAGHAVLVSNWRRGAVAHAIEEIEADLNRPLPLADAAFDAVVCREVIEHVESVPHTLREFFRLLRPGGVLVLTFPNRLLLRSRIYHLLTGFYEGMESPINLDVVQGEAHINLIGYPEMDYFLRKAGFDVTHVVSSHRKPLDRLLLVFPPAGAAGPLLPAAPRQAPEGAQQGGPGPPRLQPADPGAHHFAGPAGGQGRGAAGGQAGLRAGPASGGSRTGEAASPPGAPRGAPGLQA